VSQVIPTADAIYVRGPFTTVGGATRVGVAALNFNGTASAWNANLSPTDSIGAMAVAGNSVYLAGQFTTLGGQPRVQLGALSTSGELLPWDPNAGNFTVFDGDSVLTTTDDTVYLGGNFRGLAMTPQSSLVAISAAGTGPVQP
jgi:hypothetical protein